MRNLTFLAAITTTLTVLAACEPPVACTDIAVSSVTVTVEDAGAPFTDAEVEFSVDGGDFEACDDFGDIWACGFEVAGEIVVRVTAPNRATVERAYTISQDECHVIGVEDTIDLEGELACTEEALPSVQLTVTDGVDVIADATARWRPVTAHDEAWEDCFAGTDALFCGSEWAGEMEIEASAPGFAADTTTVAISADECHVLTEERELVLSAL